MAVLGTVNHKILIKVLENYFGIHEKASNWIMSYLQNRQFQVHTNGNSSEKNDNKLLNTTREYSWSFIV